MSVTIALLLVPVEAAAARAVVHVEGANASVVSAEIRDALPAGTTVEPSKPFDAALVHDGGGPVGRALASAKAIGPTSERIGRALAQSGAEIAIVVQAARVQRGHRGVRVLVIPKGHTERRFFKITRQDAATSRSDRVKWWAELLAEAFAQAAPEPTSETAPAEMPRASSTATTPSGANDANDANAAPMAPTSTAVGRTPEKAPAPQNVTPSASEAGEGAAAREPVVSVEARDTAEGTGRTAFGGLARREDWRVALSIESSLRRFEDSDANERSGRVYQALPVPGFSIGGEAYPLANGRVGMSAAYAQSLGVQSLTRDGRLVGTSWSRIEAAARFRFPTASHDNAPWVGVLAGYAYSAFVFSDEPAEREIPRAQYHVARVGIDARVPIDRVVVIAGAEGDWLFDIAPLGNVAASGAGAGITGRIAFGYRMNRWLLVRADGRYARLWFDLEREGAASVVDQYATVGLGAEAAF